MKKMKGFLALFLALALACASLTVFAEEAQGEEPAEETPGAAAPAEEEPAEKPAAPAGTRDCRVESLQMHFSLPADFILADEQERLAADPDGQALFLAYNEDRSFMIRIGLVYPTAHMKNLNLFEEKELLEMADSFAELYGSSDSAGTVEWINNICYIRTAALREDASPAVCETAYLTILSNHFFAIAFTAPDDASAREEIARVMDSVRYSEEMADPANSFASEGGIN